MSKFILERWEGVLYAYTESEKHFKVAEKTRSTPLLPISVLATNCEIDKIEGDFHIVIPVKK